MKKIYEMRVTLTERGFDKEIKEYEVEDYRESDMFVSAISAINESFKARIPFSILDKISERNFKDAYPFAEVMTLNQERLDDYCEHAKNRIRAHLAIEKMWIERLMEVTE